MFIGRSEEKKIIGKQLSQAGKSVILVYGKRRVGKSTLINEALTEYDGLGIYHTCVRSSFYGNLRMLSRSVCMSLGLPIMHFETLDDIFDFLIKQNKNICIVLDEYQYFKESLKQNELDSFFQVICDRLPANVKIIFCGSYISMMRELLKEDNPLFGRFTQIISLKEMDYLESSLFYEKSEIHDKISNYAVFGGSPYVLSAVNYNDSLESNIENHLIEKNGILRSHIENVMLAEVQKSYDVRILEAIGNGKKKYSEILSITGEKSVGLLDKQLKNLISMETIEKQFPINKKNDKKKTFYEINDNLMRFYFTFIFGNESIIEKIGKEAFYNSYILPKLESFVNLRFEQMVCQYFKRKSRHNELDKVKDIGSYWYDDAVNMKNGQFDCAIEYEDGFSIYEVKNFDRKMNKYECEKEIEQVLSIDGLKIKNMGFVCSSGFDFKDENYELISGEDIYIKSILD